MKFLRRRKSSQPTCPTGDTNNLSSLLHVPISRQRSFDTCARAGTPHPFTYSHRDTYEQPSGSYLTVQPDPRVLEPANISRMPLTPAQTSVTPRRHNEGSAEAAYHQPQDKKRTLRSVASQPFMRASVDDETRRFICDSEFPSVHELIDDFYPPDRSVDSITRIKEWRADVAHALSYESSRRRVMAKPAAAPPAEVQLPGDTYQPMVVQRAGNRSDGELYGPGGYTKRSRPSKQRDLDSSGKRKASPYYEAHKYQAPLVAPPNQRHHNSRYHEERVPSEY